MANPSEVNTAKFQVENVIYASDGFSISYGVWEGNSKHLAVRWDGEEGKTGFPQTFGKPQWLLVPDKLSVPFVKALWGGRVLTDSLLLVLRDMFRLKLNRTAIL